MISLFCKALQPGTNLRCCCCMRIRNLNNANNHRTYESPEIIPGERWQNFKFCIPLSLNFVYMTIIGSSLTTFQVQTWFQNRRAKAKREEREKKKQSVKSINSSPPPSSSSTGSFGVDRDAETATSSGYGALPDSSPTNLGSGSSSQTPTSLQSPSGGGSSSLKFLLFL